MFEALHYDYAIRALVSSSIVGVTCGLLGCFVILRKMALIGDALSHAILPGVVLGFIFFGHNPLAIFGGAVLAGLFTSLLITWIQRNSITKDDASIGIVFTAMFALGIIGISWLTKREGVHLDMKDFLFGNVLGVSDSDLWLTGIIGIYVIACIILFFQYFFITTFDPLIALTMGISVAVFHYFLMFLLSLTIVASIQSVGVILVVAMLIIPSSTAYLLSNRLWAMLVISALVGLISATTGFMIALWLQITPGPTMTLVASIIFGITLLISPKRGFITKAIARFQRNFIEEQQDIIKAIEKAIREPNENKHILISELKAIFNSFSTPMFKLHLFILVRRQMIRVHNDKINLTHTGKHEADVLIRAHRLWESYLVNKMNVPMDQIHESAEKMEHILPREFMDKVDKDLGYPLIDPHGSPIPKLRKKRFKLSDLKTGSTGVISEDQTSSVKELWHLGIFPNAEFVVKESNTESITIQIKNSIFVVKSEQANKININS
ncbi:MAG: metal ABC transporter permease [Bacteroidota bacterium]|nr:metal ABC transporter permease [Bacteroidota bacterium]